MPKKNAPPSRQDAKKKKGGRWRIDDGQASEDIDFDLNFAIFPTLPLAPQRLGGAFFLSPVKSRLEFAQPSGTMPDR
jgi:hypothetical protein